VVIIVKNETKDRNKCSPYERRSKYHAVKVAVVKSLDIINYLEIADRIPARYKYTPTAELLLTV